MSVMNPCHVETELIQFNQVGIMIADALDPCIGVMSFFL